MMNHAVGQRFRPHKQAWHSKNPSLLPLYRHYLAKPKTPTALQVPIGLWFVTCFSFSCQPAVIQRALNSYQTVTGNAAPAVVITDENGSGIRFNITIQRPHLVHFYIVKQTGIVAPVIALGWMEQHQHVLRNWSCCSAFLFTPRSDVVFQANPYITRSRDKGLELMCHMLFARPYLASSVERIHEMLRIQPQQALASQHRSLNAAFALDAAQIPFKQVRYDSLGRFVLLGRNNSTMYTLLYNTSHARKEVAEIVQQRYPYAAGAHRVNLWPHCFDAKSWSQCVNMPPALGLKRFVHQVAVWQSLLNRTLLPVSAEHQWCVKFLPKWMLGQRNLLIGGMCA
jgi:hypothetical protein